MLGETDSSEELLTGNPVGTRLSHCLPVHFSKDEEQKESVKTICLVGAVIVKFLPSWYMYLLKSVGI